MDQESGEWVEQALREAERRQGIAKVLSVRSEAAVAKGANYASDMYRLRVRIVTGAGELEERSVVFKALPTSPARRHSVKGSGFFSKEAKVYLDVLPELKKILKKYDAGSDILWAECYGVKGRNEGYLFEDLSAVGYKMGDRMKGLDFDHASVVVDSLAKFHALTAVLIENGDLAQNDFAGYYLADCKEIADLLFVSNLKDLADTLEHRWKGEWVDYAGRVRKFRETYFEESSAAFKSDNCKLKVLNHGDCWLNNLMFKYDRKGRPLQIRFLDFQLSYVAGPGSDLQYFFATSLRVEDTAPRKQELLELYHAALDGYLEEFSYRGERLSLGELRESYDHYRLVGVGSALAIRPLTMLPESEVPDMEKLSLEVAKGNKVNMSSYHYEGEDFVNSLKFALREGAELGVF